MKLSVWERSLVQQKEDECVWELFHENSKLSRFQKARSDEEVLQRMNDLHESLPFEGYPIIPLPDSLGSLSAPLGDTIVKRSSALSFETTPISLNQLAVLLYHSYGVTRDNTENSMPRPFRTVPSAGAMYPLEIFFHTAHVQGIPPGLYHYNPSKNCLRLLREGEETEKLSSGFINPVLCESSSIQIFLTAMFERTTWKYGERGYRFVYLEAGHVAQNLNLVATSLGLGCLNVGGFFDRDIDKYLGIDGVTHSTIYVALIGKSV
ncbi:MAG: SagB/ThcOx family dehydrogenase [Nitrospirae bacterium]|nr:SagB/ThcOx family dehydrogenase [Nitrospirota bacterium]